MFQIKGKLLYNKRVRGNYFHCKILAAKIASSALPGQFVNIRVSDSIEPLLRRPFGVHRACPPHVEVLYEVLGQGTQILAQKKAGEYLDIIGPLGCGFTHAQGARSMGPVILVAGGMGVAPLVFLAEKLGKFKIKNSKSKNLVLIGAKTANQILCEKEFQALGCDVKMATDDGSRGFKGKVTELLKDILASSFKLQASSRNITKPAACSLQPAAVIYACGPKPMLKQIAIISQHYNIPAQISLEEHMACGIGACLGCAVNTKNGYKLVCKEGPVFNAEEIIW